MPNSLAEAEIAWLYKTTSVHKNFRFKRLLRTFNIVFLIKRIFSLAYISRSYSLLSQRKRQQIALDDENIFWIIKFKICY